MNVLQLLGAISTVLLFIVGGGCILLYGMTATLRANNGDLKERVGILEESDARKDALIKSQEAEIAALRKVVTGEVQLVAISDLLEHHHTQSVAHWEALTARLDAARLGTTDQTRGAT